MTSTKPRILIVDDVEANLVALRAVLDGVPCTVVEARSGNEALKLLLKERFFAMVLDVQMPEMDGYEVARYARSHPQTRSVPILFLTAKHDTDDDALKGYGTGAVDFLFKPISPIVLRSKVRVFLDLYESRQRVEKTLEDLKLTQAQLIQSAKLAALGELVAGVAHEINNPLAFAKGHLKTARSNLSAVEPSSRERLSEEEKSRWDKAMNRLVEMDRGLERISELVLQLRTFSRLDEGKLKRVSLEECISSVLFILQYRLGEGIDVALDLKGPAEVECYPHPLNLALLNLLSNAIDAVGMKGRIQVSTRQDGEMIEIRVADDGPGIPNEHLDKIFDPFFTSKPVGQGTGLGLSISYSIAQKHKGTLTLKNVDPGVEAVFRFPLGLEQKEES